MTNIENNDEMMMQEATDNRVLLSEDGEEFVSSEVQEIQGRDGDDTIIGALNATEPGSTLFGNGGDDYIRSRGIGDRVFGGRGNDTIVNDNGKAIIYGDLGNDFIIAKDSNTTIFGGRSFGEATAEEGKNILLSLGGKNILKGGGGNDSLVGEAGGDTMAGNSGDDTVISGPGGRSFLFGNEGADRLISRANDNPDTLFGGKGEDSLIVEGAADAPLLFGGVGNDVLKVTNASVNNAILVADVNPDGSFGGSDGDEGDNYLYVEGGAGHQLFGNAGNDTLALGVNVTASVSLFGGAGDDYIFGGSDASYSELKIFGGRGDDTILFNEEAGSGVSNSVIWGDNEFVSDGFGDNVIKVRGSGNTLRGGNDNATTENAGDNFIQAIAVNLEERGSTNNLLVGGAGNDTIDAGNSGRGDTLNGGPAGNNTYIFGPGQKIVQDTVGNNTYFGVKADLDDAVTVTSGDIIGGAANFFVTGNQSNVLTLGTGGIITTDSDKTQILKIDNATGTTKTGGGDDQLKFGNVSGLVDAGAGDDVIDISGSVSGSVSGGAGNDIINVNGSDGVTEGGAILGGEGDDQIFAKVVQAGGLIDGGEGADTIEVNSLFGVVKGGGLGKNVFKIGEAFGGAQIFTGAGDEEVVLGAIGSTDGDDLIFIKGGIGNNKLGFSYDEDNPTNADVGSDMARLEIQGVGGNNIIQGTPFGKDILKGGADTDVLYGGASNFDGSNADPNDLGQVGLKIGDGDELISGKGQTTFLFRTWDETGKVQSSFSSIEITETPEGDMDNYVLSFGTDFGGKAKNVTPGFLDGGTNFVSGGFHVDTLTGFNYKAGKDTGDRIFLDDKVFGDFVGTDVSTAKVETFTSAYGGFLFTAIEDGAFAFNGSDADVDDAFNAQYFKSGFVVGGTTFNIGTGAGFFFDTTTKGVYLSPNNSDKAYLVAVLDKALPTDATFESVFTVGPIAEATAAPGVELF